MYECLDLFSEATRTWFRHAFDHPTEAQRQAWPVIQAGENVLVVAPTGSGKTLCAFLSAIDRLMSGKERQPAQSSDSKSGKPADGVKVLYVSPLKALGADVAKNLQAPLDGISKQCETMGIPAPNVSVAMRSGDTTPQERRRIVSHPPDILVTTPESLFLMLTSQARRILSTVETVIVDEIHAVAGTKRGAHLALSLERLDELTEKPAQRIGLSATVNPVEEVARFLGGSKPVRIVRPQSRPDMEIKVVEPLADMLDTSATGGSVWPAIERSVLDEVLAHRTTLVFVNSRGLAEKLTARLNDLYTQSRDGSIPQYQDMGSPEGREHFARHYDSVVGSTTMLVESHEDADAIAMAHHGSVSKDRRKQIEEQLKRGQLRCVVATSSLELGIDMGSVDLVIQIAPPLSVSSGLQRVGRADHKVGGVSHALFYPVTRQQIIGMVASVESMRSGDLEPLRIISNPLDVLAQQTVAVAAMHDLKPDEWYAVVRRSAPFRNLERSMFDATMGMMTGAYNSEDFSAFRPPLQCDEESGFITARPGAARLAVTSGGTIPDRGMYTVVLPEEGSGPGPRKVGELDEEMVYESRVGDVITLGTSTWQIQEITHDRVVVLPAPGRTARLPFWHGDQDGRDYHFGMTEGRLVRELSRELSAGTGESAGKPKFTASAERRLRDDGLDDNAIGNLVALLAEQRESAGIVPNDRELVVERSREEDGDWRIIVHSPFGRRVHEPWAMAITTRLKQRYGFDGQVHAADDGIILRLPDGYADMRARDLILFDCDELQHIVETQIGESVLYMARFRECAARSLFLPRTRPGKRVPLWQQRLKAAQLLNAARTCRNFPLLLETARECLQDVYDLPALRQVMAGLNDGVIDLSETATRTPSPFAEQLLFGFVGSVMYQYDVPQAERSTQLLSMDPEVLERLLGAADMASLLDPDAIAQVEKDLAGRTFWNDLDEDDVTGRVTRYAKTHGPFTADQMIAQLRIDAARAVYALDELNAKGTLLKGRFSDPDQTTDQWLHIEVFRRIRSLSLAKARRAVKPVDQAAYQAFLLDRQGVGPVGGARYEGVDGLLRVIEQLEGVPLNADVWESSVFPARVRDYEPGMLDELLASGEVVWVGSKFNGSNGKDAGSIAFHPADSRLLDVPDGSEQNESSDTDAMTVPEAVLAVLNGGGAFPARQLSSMAKTLWQNHAEIQVNAETGEIMYPSWNEERFEEALWFLIWQGRITNSSFMPVRSLSHRHGTVRAPRMSARRRVRMRPSIPATLGGLWSAVNPDGTVGSDDSTRPSGVEEYEIELVESLLDRYGVLASPLVDKERIPGGFSGLYPVLKRMEEHGLLVRGMFVKGFGAAQFASRNTVDVLRDEHASRGLSCVALDVTDPAVLTGAAIAWPQQEHLKPARRAGSIIVLAKGAPVMFAMPKSHKIASFTDDEPTLRSACAELAYTLQRLPSGSVSFAEMNGESLNARNDARRLLRAAGFADSPQGMKLYR
ncbi:DEAD/DEAH box helicase [Bifidobacterium ruminantium]|uniref:DEAD/DEAH box helicase n=1 Tax=Bifidobacterium ruminantium TaxID=78346 RepID=UPI00255C9150|nr:DEAD/DEAH box helicase [Bifidobacterium ruminantium]